MVYHSCLQGSQCCTLCYSQLLHARLIAPTQPCINALRVVIVACSVSVGANSPTATSSGLAPTFVSQHPSGSSHEQAGTSQARSSALPAPAAAAADLQAKGLPSLQFDPLKRRKRAKPAGVGTAAAAAASDAGSGDAARPALTPQVQQLQEDLAKLVSEWSQGAVRAHGSACRCRCASWLLKLCGPTYCCF